MAWDVPAASAEEYTGKPPKPFHTVHRKQEEDRQVWLRDAFYFCRHFYKAYNGEVQRNLAAYQGHFFNKSQTRQEYDAKTFESPYRVPVDDRLTTNYAHEYTEEFVSRITTFKPSFAVIPANSNQLKDIINAKTVKAVIDSILYDKKFDLLYQRVIRHTKVTGEGAAYITWDPNSGPMSKESQILAQVGPIQETTPDDLISIEKGAHAEIVQQSRDGELKFEDVAANHMYPEPRPYGGKGDWEIRFYYEPTDTLKAKYSKVADKIEPDKGGHWDPYTDKMIKAGDHTTVIELWHPDTNLVPGGWQILATTEVILQEGELEYEHKEIPRALLKDIEVDGVLRGKSFFDLILPLQNKVNDLRYYINRNQRMFSHPKWLVEIGSLNKKHLKNMPGIIPVQPGAMKPELLQFASTHPEIFEYLRTCVDDMRQLAGLHAISEGDQPKKGISGIALSILKQEENQRYNSFLAKSNNFMIEAITLAWKTQVQFTRGNRDLVLKMLGPDNEYVYKKLSEAALNTQYDVRAQNQNALGDTKASQVATSLEFFDRGVFDKDDVIETNALGSASKSLNKQKEPGRTAQIENEQIIDGMDCPVLATDDHYEHYKEHYPQLQEQRLREAPPQIRGDIAADSPVSGLGLSGHLMQHVMCMVDQVKYEMAFLPQPPSLLKYSQLPGWTLLAGQFMAPGAPPISAPGTPPPQGGMSPGGGPPPNIPPDGQAPQTAINPPAPEAQQQ